MKNPSPRKLPLQYHASNDLCYAELQTGDAEKFEISTQDLMSVIGKIRAKGLDLLKIKGIILTTKNEGVYHTLHVYHEGMGIVIPLTMSLGRAGFSDHYLIFTDDKILHHRGHDAVPKAEDLLVYPPKADQTGVYKRRKKD